MRVVAWLRKRPWMSPQSRLRFSPETNLGHPLANQSVPAWQCHAYVTGYFLTSPYWKLA